MTIENIGYGAGTKDFAEQANVLRLFVGTSSEITTSGYLSDEVWLLETNIDNLSGEIIGYTVAQLLNAGALDVFTIPIYMKKQRPGVLLSVLVEDQLVQQMEAILFAETGTLGIRRSRRQRHKLHREVVKVSTPWGEIQGKIAWKTGDRPHFTPEYEGCLAVARKHGVSLAHVYRVVRDSYSAVTKNN